MKVGKPMVMAFLFLGSFVCGSGSEKRVGPTIDIHLHAQRLSKPGSTLCPFATDPLAGAALFGTETTGPCPNLLIAPRTEAELRQKTLQAMDRNGIEKAVISALSLSRVQEWQAAAPGRFVAGLSDFGQLSLEQVRDLFLSGKVGVLGELGPQYVGKSLADPSYEPYLALAEKLDVPVVVHMGFGFAGGRPDSYPKFRAAWGDPLLLEEVLVRHPRLRVCVAHAGWPMLDSMLNLLFNYRQVYVDISGIDWGVPKKEFYFYLQRIVQAGFGKRVLYGSDMMCWPEVIDLSLRAIDVADFLTDEQKRDIFYNNAARFLKLDKGLQK
jgi:predicted TIM-barrel fold metal-dependent hydrolase